MNKSEQRNPITGTAAQIRLTLEEFAAHSAKVFKTPDVLIVVGDKTYITDGVSPLNELPLYLAKPLSDAVIDAVSYSFNEEGYTKTPGGLIVHNAQGSIDLVAFDFFTAEGKIDASVLPDMASAGVTSVADISDRDYIEDNRKYGLVVVFDATDDYTVTNGSAVYTWSDDVSESGGWVKIAEQDSMDIDFNKAFLDAGMVMYTHKVVIRPVSINFLLEHISNAYDEIPYTPPVMNGNDNSENGYVVSGTESEAGDELWHANDGQLDTQWTSSATAEFPVFYNMHFTEDFKLSKVSFTNREDAVGVISDYSIEVQNEDDTWSTLYEGTNTTVEGGEDWDQPAPADDFANDYRLVITSVDSSDESNSVSMVAIVPEGTHRPIITPEPEEPEEPEVPELWSPALLTSNGVVGTDEYALTSNVNELPGYDLWRSYNSDTSDNDIWGSDSDGEWLGDVTYTMNFYDLVNLKEIEFTNRSYAQEGLTDPEAAPSVMLDMAVEAYNGTKWVKLWSGEPKDKSSGATWTLQLTNGNYYHVYRVVTYKANTYDEYLGVSMAMIKPKGYKKDRVLESPVYPDDLWSPAFITSNGTPGEDQYALTSNSAVNTVGSITYDLWRAHEEGPNISTSGWSATGREYPVTYTMHFRDLVNLKYISITNRLIENGDNAGIGALNGYRIEAFDGDAWVELRYEAVLPTGINPVTRHPGKIYSISFENTEYYHSYRLVVLGSITAYSGVHFVSLADVRPYGYRKERELDNPVYPTEDILYPEIPESELWSPVRFSPNNGIGGQVGVDEYAVRSNHGYAEHNQPYKAYVADSLNEYWKSAEMTRNLTYEMSFYDLANIKEINYKGVSSSYLVDFDVEVFDGTDWVVLKSITGNTDHEFTIDLASNEAYYYSYRLNIASVSSNNNDLLVYLIEPKGYKKDRNVDSPVYPEVGLGVFGKPPTEPESGYPYMTPTLTSSTTPYTDDYAITCNIAPYDNNTVYDAWNLANGLNGATNIWHTVTINESSYPVILTFSFSKPKNIQKATFINRNSTVFVGSLKDYAIDVKVGDDWIQLFKDTNTSNVAAHVFENLFHNEHYSDTYRIRILSSQSTIHVAMGNITLEGYDDYIDPTELWTPSVLTSNGTPGIDEYAVSSNKDSYDGTREPWRSYDGEYNVNNDTMWLTKDNTWTGDVYYNMYFREQMKLSQIEIKNRQATVAAVYTPIDYRIEAFNGNEWIILLEATNDNRVNGGTWYIDLEHEEFYHAYRLCIESVVPYSNGAMYASLVKIQPRGYRKARALDNPTYPWRDGSVLWSPKPLTSNGVAGTDEYAVSSNAGILNIYSPLWHTHDGSEAPTQWHTNPVTFPVRHNMHFKDDFCLKAMLFENRIAGDCITSYEMQYKDSEGVWVGLGVVSNTYIGDLNTWYYETDNVVSSKEWRVNILNSSKTHGNYVAMSSIIPYGISGDVVVDPETPTEPEGGYPYVTPELTASSVIENTGYMISVKPEDLLAGYEPWRVTDTVYSDWLTIGPNKEYYEVFFTFSTPKRIEKLVCKNRSADITTTGYYPIDYSIQAKDTSGTWTTLHSGTNTSIAIGEEWDVLFANNEYYTEYKLCVTSVEIYNDNGFLCMAYLGLEGYDSDSTEIPTGLWSPAYLTSNGTPGVDEYAVSSNDDVWPGYDLWKAYNIDSSDTDSWGSASTGTWDSDVTYCMHFYDLVNLKEIDFRNRSHTHEYTLQDPNSASSVMTNFTVDAFNGDSWVTLFSGAPVDKTNGAEWTLTLSNENYYHSYRINVKAANTYTAYTGVSMAKIKPKGYKKDRVGEPTYPTGNESIIDPDTLWRPEYITANGTPGVDEYSVSSPNNLYGNYDCWQCHDGDNSTMWIADHNATASDPVILNMDFKTPKRIIGISSTNRSANYHILTSFVFDIFKDGDWVELYNGVSPDTNINAKWNVIFENNDYSEKYRLRITGDVTLGGDAYLAVAELCPIGYDDYNAGFEWTAPVLTSNGTPGVDEYALSSNAGPYNSGSDLFQMTDSSTITTWHSVVSPPIPTYINMTFSTPKRITSVYFSNMNNPGYVPHAMKNYQIEVKNSSGEWTILHSNSGIPSVVGHTWTDEFDNIEYSTEYRVVITAGHTGYFQLLAMIPSGYTLSEDNSQLWSPAYLTSDGTPGVDEYAVSSNLPSAASQYSPWLAYDGNITTYSVWVTKDKLSVVGNASYSMHFYDLVNLKEIDFTNWNQPGYTATSFSVDAFDGSKWVVLKDVVNEVVGTGDKWSVSLDNDGYYHSYRLNIAEVHPYGDDTYVTIAEIVPKGIKKHREIDNPIYPTEPTGTLENTK